MKNKLITLLSWAAVFLWMSLIFYLSSQVASQSDELSQGMAEQLLGVIVQAFPGLNGDLHLWNFVLRKGAHFMSYLILGVLTMNALGRSGIKGVRQVSIALGVCVIYAISDEVHQLFVLGRSGQVRDVLIDSAGAIVGSQCHRRISLIKGSQ